MKIQVRFMCAEALGALKSETYELPEGCTPVQLLLHARRQAGLSGEAPLDQLLYLRNGQPAPADAVLADGDQLIVLRKLYGG